MTRAARNHCAAARERPCTPVKLARVSRHDPHIFDLHSQHIGDQLREHREVTLSLRTDAGGAANLAARLDRHARSLVRADARAFDVTHNTDADVASFGAQPRLLVAHEVVVADDLGRLFERRQIVAAVVNQRRGILKHDLVIHRKSVRRDQVALADLDAVDAQLARGQIEQPLADEDAVLAPGAPHRGHDRLVGEDRRKLALVVGNIVGPEQRALTVDGNGQPIRVVCAGVEQEYVMHADDAALAGERHLCVVHLSPLLRRRVEVLLAILGPLQRPIQPHRRPRQQHLFRVEHHDLRPEAAADERRDDVDLRFQQSEHRRKPVSNRDGSLRGVPDRHLLGLSVPVDRDGAILDRGRNAAIVMEPPLHDDVGCLLRGRRSPLFAAPHAPPGST